MVATPDLVSEEVMRGGKPKFGGGCAGREIISGKLLTFSEAFSRDYIRLVGSKVELLYIDMNMKFDTGGSYPAGARSAPAGPKG